MVLETAPLPEDICKLGVEGGKQDLEGRKTERRRNEEGKDPGIGCRAQRWEVRKRRKRQGLN